MEIKLIRAMATLTKEVEERLTKDDAQIRVIALTIVAIALNSLLAIPAYQAVVNLLGTGTLNSAMLTVFLSLNIIITPIYCWAASLVFHPKRIINPLYIQLASVGVVTIFVLLVNAHQFLSLQAFLTFLGGIVGTFLFTLFFLGIFGLFQLLIVRWLVELVGTIDDLDRKTFLVNADFQTVLGILLSESFLSAWNLEHRKRGKDLIEIYTSYSAPWQIRLVLGPAQESNKSILATVAFEKKFYTIFKSDKVSDCRDDMVRRLKSIIGVKKFRLIGFNDNVSHTALRSALSVTEPKTIIGREALGEVPSFYRNILILMGTIVAIVTGLYIFGFVPLDLFATSLIMIAIALAIELGPRLKEIMDSKKSV